MASEAWQIGSLAPPTICLCCGTKFDDLDHKIRGPYETGPYRYVCEWCWKKSYMFFPDKEIRGHHFVPPFDAAAILSNAPSLELEIIEGRKLDVQLVTVPIYALRLNPENPRVKHRTGGDESEIENWLWQETGTRSLYNEIRYSGGLSEKPIIDSSFTVVEGNRRIVCLRKLDDQAKNGELPESSESAFEKVQCFMLPDNVDRKDVALLIARIHVSGKREWSPLSQAEQVFEMATKGGLSLFEIGSALSLSPKRSELMLKAYRATLEYGDAYPDIDGKWIHKFSYFYELFRSQSLSQWATDAQNLRMFFELISGNHPKIAKGNQVRNLGPILADPKAINMLRSEGFDSASDWMKKRQSRIDQSAKTLHEVSETIRNMAKGSIRMTAKNAVVLNEIRDRIDDLLLSRSKSSASRPRKKVIGLKQRAN